MAESALSLLNLEVPVVPTSQIQEPQRHEKSTYTNGIETSILPMKPQAGLHRMMEVLV